MSRAAAATPSVSSRRRAAKCATSAGMRARSRSNVISRTRSKAVGDSLFMMNSPDCADHLSPPGPLPLLRMGRRSLNSPALITTGWIDHVLQRLAAFPAVEIVAEHLDRALFPAVIDAGAMRGHDHALHVPERIVLGQRLGLEHVEHRAP